MKKPLKKRTLPGPSPIDGWGLFAATLIHEGDILDESPLVILDEPPSDQVSRWCYDTDHGPALVLGDGVLCNSSDEPNACFRIDWRHGVVQLLAMEQIQPDTEITIDYAPEA